MKYNGTNEEMKYNGTNKEDVNESTKKPKTVMTLDKKFNLSKRHCTKSLDVDDMSTCIKQTFNVRNEQQQQMEQQKQLQDRYSVKKSNKTNGLKDDNRECC